MKEVTINGVEYQPASLLAKQFRYTTDYIGQLCRSKKVEAQLVGRSWYVNPASLTNHKKGRYVKSPLGEKTSDYTYEVKLSRLDVEPVISKNSVKMSSEVAINKNFSKRMDWKPLKYEVDAADLLPQFQINSNPSKIKVDLADSIELSIKETSKPTVLEAEELPTVSLKGKLKVASLEQDFDAKEEVLLEEVPLPPLPRPVRVAKKPIHLSLPTRMSVKRVEEEKNYNKSSPQVVSASLFVPKSVLKNEVEEENGIEFVQVSLITTTGLLLVCLLLIFFAESNIYADASSYTWGIDFSTRSLTALVSLF